MARFSDDVVHEKLLPFNNTAIGKLEHSLLHYSYPDANAYWRKLQVYSLTVAEQKYQQGQTTSMSRAIGSGLAAFIRSYVFRFGVFRWRHGLGGLYIAGSSRLWKILYFVLFESRKKITMRIASFGTLLLGCCFALTATAQFRVEISGIGITQIPIAMANFRGEEQCASKNHPNRGCGS
jgi:hypothetical protein